MARILVDVSCVLFMFVFLLILSSLPSGGRVRAYGLPRAPPFPSTVPRFGVFVFLSHQQALKALEAARKGLDACSDDLAVLDGKRDQVSRAESTAAFSAASKRAKRCYLSCSGPSGGRT